MASLAPPEQQPQPFDWGRSDDFDDGVGIAAGWIVAGVFAVAALLLGFLVIYAALV